MAAPRAPIVFAPPPPVSPPPLEAEQPNAAPSEVEPPERLPEPEPLEDAPRAVIAMLIEPPVATPPEVEPLELEPLPEPEALEEAPRAVIAIPIESPPPVVEDAPPPAEIALPEPTPLEVAPPEIAPPLETPPARRMRRSKVSPHARPHRVLRGARKTHADEAPAPVAPDGPPSPKTVEPAARESFWASAGLPDPVPEARTGRDSPLVEACFAMYQEKRYGEVVVRAEDTLANVPDELPASLAHETAALWAVLALAKQALGDDEGAATALASAMETAPQSERSAYRRHFATLTLDAARMRLARARSHEVGDRVETIRAAINWTDRGLAVVADDTELADLRETAHEALWSAYERAVARLLQRQDFNGARLLLREPLEDPALPPARAEGFHTMFAGTFAGEVGQLTAQAIRSLQEAREADALESLQRAEDLLATIPGEALPAKRREEVDQRLWWAYTELGKRRLTAGDAEKALAPLRHALGFDAIGPDRQTETRTTLVQALEGVTTARTRSIRRLAEGGQRPVAVARVEDLRALLQGYAELGLTEDELSAPTAQIRHLCAELGFADPA
jgi:tetratricopeptide (TPR) repeat protein